MSRRTVLALEGCHDAFDAHRRLLHDGWEYLGSELGDDAPDRAIAVYVHHASGQTAILERARPSVHGIVGYLLTVPG